MRGEGLQDKTIYLVRDRGLLEDRLIVVASIKGEKYARAISVNRKQRITNKIRENLVASVRNSISLVDQYGMRAERALEYKDTRLLRDFPPDDFRPKIYPIKKITYYQYQKLTNNDIL